MSEQENYPRLSRYKTPQAFRERLAELGLDLPVDDELISANDGSPLAQTITAYGKTIGNRWCVQPMEGWDGTPDGKPSEHTLRRWRNFGLSGAKLIFGGEAVAVRHDGRANPNQLTFKPENKDGIAAIRHELVTAHQDKFGTTDDLFIGLQLTHSGRFCRPDADHKLKPRILYHHPILDKKFGIKADDDSVLFNDDDIDDLITYYIKAAKMAEDTGYEFVDVKHCHGYLGHEFLSAFTREGKYGGRFENRTCFLRNIVEGIHREAPSLHIAVRLSAFDFVPYRDDEATRRGIHKGIGIPEDFAHCLPYQYGFGVNQDNPLEMNLAETYKFLELLQELKIELVNLTCGSPYYNPHIQRPAYFPPSDGYRPPEDPLMGVARQIHAVKQVKEKFPHLAIVGTGYSYLQEFLPLVAQAVVRSGWVDIIGYGRGILSYPELPADSLAGKVMDKKRVCRTFSDCTTAPRNHILSGCFPLDDYYKELPEAKRVKEIKAQNV